MNNVPKLIKFWRNQHLVRPARLFCSETDISENQETEGHEKFINEVRLLGRVGKDPLIRNVDGKHSAKFPFVTVANWQGNDGELKKKNEWHNIISFKPKSVEYISNFVKKGQRLYISGRLSYFEIETAETNMKNKYSFILLSHIIFLRS